MKYLSLFLSVVSCLVLGACGKDPKPSSELANAQPQGLEQSSIKGVQQMQAMAHHDTTTWKGSLYRYAIDRKPDTTLPLVTDDGGARYADNRVEIIVNDAQGGVFFRHTFTKAEFEPYLSNDFRSYGVLEGMAFDVDRISDTALHFAASICYPQTDLFVAFDVSVSATGKMIITKSTSYSDAAPVPSEASEADGV
ncbi:MAG: DUF4738 domain-containing protein [Bacteroidaceae bacterium]